MDIEKFIRDTANVTVPTIKKISKQEVEKNIRRKKNRLKAIEIRRNRSNIPIDLVKPWKRQFIEAKKIEKPPVNRESIVGDVYRPRRET